MPTIDATVGGANSNSYITILDATTYFDGRLYATAWADAIVAGTEDTALVEACRILDRLDFIGDKATTTQALKWPRVTNDFYDDYHTEDFPYASNVIPPQIKYAQCEIALSRLAAGGEAVAAGAVESLEIGGVVKAKYSAGSSGEVVDTTVDWYGLPERAANWLKGLRLLPVLM